MSGFAVVVLLKTVALLQTGKPAYGRGGKHNHDATVALCVANSECDRYSVAPCSTMLLWLMLPPFKAGQKMKLIRP